MQLNRWQRTTGRRARAALAALAMLFVALAPAVGNALGQSGPAMWVELCAADGSKRYTAVTDAAADPATPATAKHIGEHCPFCHLEQSTLALPAPAACHIATQNSAAERPLLFFHAVRRLHAWAPALSRGPPAHT